MARPIHVYVTDKQYRYLRWLSAAEDVSIGGLVRAALDLKYGDELRKVDPRFVPQPVPGRPLERAPQVVSAAARAPRARGGGGGHCEVGVDGAGVTAATAAGGRAPRLDDFVLLVRRAVGALRARRPRPADRRSDQLQEQAALRGRRAGSATTTST